GVAFLLRLLAGAGLLDGLAFLLRGGGLGRGGAGSTGRGGGRGRGRGPASRSARGRSASGLAHGTQGVSLDVRVQLVAVVVDRVLDIVVDGNGHRLGTAHKRLGRELGDVRVPQRTLSTDALLGIESQQLPHQIDRVLVGARVALGQRAWARV